MNNHVLKMVTSNPYFGVELDSSWTGTSTSTSSPPRPTGSWDFSTGTYGSWYCPRQVKERVYLTLVRPKLEYCSPIWNPHQWKYIRKVESIQHQAARFILQKPHRNNITKSITDMVQSLGWQTLETRRLVHSLTSLYKINNSLVEIPAKYKPCLKRQRTTRRSNQQQMEHYQCEVNAFWYSLLPRTVPAWNKIPEDIVSAPDELLQAETSKLPPVDTHPLYIDSTLYRQHCIWEALLMEVARQAHTPHAST
jgi:hypothetical protein